MIYTEMDDLTLAINLLLKKTKAFSQSDRLILVKAKSNSLTWLALIQETVEWKLDKNMYLICIYG